MIKEIPILLNAEMVKAVLDGRKVCTRRPLKKIIPEGYSFDGLVSGSTDKNGIGAATFKALDNAHWLISENPPCRYQDILYVRENFKLGAVRYLDDRLTIMYMADGLHAKLDKSKHPLRSETLYPVDMTKHERVRPSIHMPKWASRIKLKVTNIRVERVQDITDNDCIREGIEIIDSNVIPDLYYCRDYSEKRSLEDWTFFEGNERESFKTLWDSIYKNWDKNPWVWVIDFEVVKK